ncbi:MAG: hypothetical protein KDE01_22740, partial [Caldilineaceae bacterium]|nr:hypothetical protein [Caldilineaceae bacterium]
SSSKRSTPARTVKALPDHFCGRKEARRKLRQGATLFFFVPLGVLRVLVVCFSIGIVWITG